MNSLQFDLLRRIRDGEISSVSDLTPEQKLLFDQMTKFEWIQPLKVSGPYPQLSASGLSALSAHQDKIDREAQQQAQRDAERKSDRANALVDKQKDYRHDFAVAAFGAAMALFFEHLGDIIDFVQILLEKALSLFH